MPNNHFTYNLEFENPLVACFKDPNKIQPTSSEILLEWLMQTDKSIFSHLMFMSVLPLFLNTNISSECMSKFF